MRVGKAGACYFVRQEDELAAAVAQEQLHTPDSLAASSSAASQAGTATTPGSAGVVSEIGQWNWG